MPTKEFDNFLDFIENELYDASSDIVIIEDFKGYAERHLLNITKKLSTETVYKNKKSMRRQCRELKSYITNLDKVSKVTKKKIIKIKRFINSTLEIKLLIMQLKSGRIKNVECLKLNERSNNKKCQSLNLSARNAKGSLKKSSAIYLAKKNKKP